ncbi:hypothetical protein BDL97_03G117200 [Sphagnum fallax]|jgi:LysM repeat protein|nr:hypothetical protein BDL97_03G117200 [Sphagnum fallax]
MALTSSVLLPAAIVAGTGLVPNSSSSTHLAFATKQQRVSQGARLVQPTTRVMASTEGGGGPNPMRFFQSFKDSLFQDHKRIQLEQSKLPKGHDFVYKVEKGDTLWKIAERHNTSIDLLMEANNITDPHNLAQGQEIWIPRTYQIQKGDTLYSLAKKFGVKMESIQAANGIEDPNFIHAGDFIVLPEEANAEDLGLVS